MALPETCGTAGGAISLWVNVIDCPRGGIISSYVQGGASSSLLYCSGNNMVYDTFS